MSSSDGRGPGRGGIATPARAIAIARPISRRSAPSHTTAQSAQSAGTSGGSFAPTATGNSIASPPVTTVANNITASATNTDTFGNRTMSVSPNQHGAKRYKFDDDFTVLVGQDEVRFVIYKDVFSHRSEFFRAACSQDFKESREKTIRMPEADPEDFRAYMQWAYGGEIVVMSPEEIASGTDPLCALQQLRLGQLYTLANFLGDIRLKNGVTDQIIGLCRTISPTPGFVSYLYEHVPDNSRLRGYILDWFLYRPSPNWLEKYRSELPPAFIADLLIAGAKANFDRKQLVNPHGRSWCYYHQRDTASICPCDLPAPDH